MSAVGADMNPFPASVSLGHDDRRLKIMCATSTGEAAVSTVKRCSRASWPSQGRTPRPSTTCRRSTRSAARKSRMTVGAAADADVEPVGGLLDLGEHVLG